MKKKILLLGATGSIGESSLNVIEKNSHQFLLIAISGFSQIDKLIKIAKKFKPKYIWLPTNEHYDEVKKLKFIKKIFIEDAGLKELINLEEIDLIINGISSIHGLFPTYYAIEANKKLLLANKESLVLAGHLFKNNLKNIIPIDSEINTVFQLVNNEKLETIKKVWLTASGGPFSKYNKDQLSTIKKEEVFKHPTWKMGPKITVDSSTLVNKAYEMIELKYLFNLELKQIEPIIQHQSLIHSLVEFQDGNIKALFSKPTMEIAINHALNYPNRNKFIINDFSLDQINTITFSKINEDIFKSIKIVKQIFDKDPFYFVAFNAINDCLVKLFIDQKIEWNYILPILELKLFEFKKSDVSTIENIIKTYNFIYNKIITSVGK